MPARGGAALRIVSAGQSVEWSGAAARAVAEAVHEAAR
jgi:hypothetical protein